MDKKLGNISDIQPKAQTLQKSSESLSVVLLLHFMLCVLFAVVLHLDDLKKKEKVQISIAKA